MEENTLFINYKSFYSQTSYNKIERKLRETLKGRKGDVFILYATLGYSLKSTTGTGELQIVETYEPIEADTYFNIIDEAKICFDLGANMLSFYYFPDNSDEKEFLFSICVTGVDKQRYKPQ